MLIILPVIATHNPGMMLLTGGDERVDPPVTKTLPVAL